MTASELNSRVLQLDTFVETIGCIPMLHGKRLHVPKSSLCTYPEGERRPALG